MTVRKGYIYALILAIGLLLWTEAWDAWQHPTQVSVEEAAQSTTAEKPWASAEAVYECAMKARELKLDMVNMHVAADTLQGSMDIHGKRDDLQAFYTWLETEGRFRAILSFQLKTEDEAHSQLTVSYQL